MLTIEVDTPWTAPPAWALLQRALFKELSAAVRPFWDRYVTADDELRWGGTGQQHGRDDKDDFYEAFYNWPLLYLLGGDAGLLPLSHRAWDGVTRLLDRLGLVEREFDVGADFFHQGEGLTFFYHLCMADPTNRVLRDRAVRFADMYTGNDPVATNYDPDHRIIRAPHTGSRGPLPGYRDGDPTPDWPASMEVYGLPFDDVPGVSDFASLSDKASARRLGEAMQRRFGQGDVVSNLGATSLAANAYLVAGEERFRTWVVEYTAAWRERAAANGGLVPDNVGPDGRVGTLFDGRWYGGLYGWTWPHGLYNIGQSTAIAGMNAALLSGDRGFLDLARWQFDTLLSMARVEDVRTLPMSLAHHWLPHLGFASPSELVEAPDPVLTLVVPYRHGANGWFDWQPLLPSVPASLWAMSQAAEDRDRLDRLRAGDRTDWTSLAQGRTKEDAGHEGAWISFLAGENPSFPEDILGLVFATAGRRLAQIRADETDLLSVGDDEVHTLVHHWQKLNPVTTEALVLLTLGAPQPIYNGGLLFARLRYWDAQEDRPGLPADVAALVRKIEGPATEVELCNVSLREPRTVIVQAGAFGEHEIEDVAWDRRTSDYPGPIGSYTGPAATVERISAAVGASAVRVVLPPAHATTLHLTMRMNVNRPSYHPGGSEAALPPAERA